MFFKQIKRIFYFGLVYVVRRAFVSFSAIFVMTVTLFVIGFSFLFGQMIDNTLDSLHDKIDITIYFKQEATENQIAIFKQEIQQLPEVEEVVYVSQVAALEEYRQRNATNIELLRGVEILNSNGINPFRPRISIRATDTEYLESITSIAENSDTLSDNPNLIIDKIDYYENKQIIGRLASLIDTANFFSRTIIGLLVLIAFVIIFNIIRLIIYLSREEIGVMRLIGANDWYVRSPFLVSGALYGFIGAILAIILLYPMTTWLGPRTANFFGNDGIFSYYVSEFGFLTILLILVGIIVGIVSSLLSSQRYLD